MPDVPGLAPSFRRTKRCATLRVVILYPITGYGGVYNADVFPIGFWNYTKIADCGPEAVADWKAAGMTLAMSPNYGPAEEEVRRMRAILDVAAEQDIRAILCDSRASWPHLTHNGEDIYRRDMQTAIRQIGEHPAILGFHVGDEPGQAAFPHACRAYRIQKELAPHLTPFLNLLQWNPNVHKIVGYEDWEQYLDAYMEQSQADILAYDCYSQMLPDGAGIDMYFRNLRLFQQAGERHKVPFWPTQLSVGGRHYRCPNEDDLRWQLGTAVAHGAKGLLWFFFYMRRPHANFRLSPIDEHGERTVTFDALSRVCRTFLNGPAATIQGLTLKRVHHVGTAYGGTPLLDTRNGPVGRVLNVELLPGMNSVPAYREASAPLIVSQFVDGHGHDHVMMVNNSQTVNAHTWLTLRCRAPSVVRIGWKGGEERCAVAPRDNTDAVNTSATVDMWLAPGQMELFRLERDDGTGG